MTETPIRTTKVARVDARRRWEEAMREARLRDVEFTTLSGSPLKPVYTPDDVELDPAEDLGYPGSFQYTRGVDPSMYSGRPGR